MKILFITLAYPPKGAHNLYSDLLLELRNNGHEVFVVCQSERRNNQKTIRTQEEDLHVLRVQTPNITGDVSKAEKGISTLTVGYLFNRAIQKHFADETFDAILYSTPPITLAGVVKKQKHDHKAQTYLLLKDIFPQNAVDIGIIRPSGLLHRYFRKKEEQLYNVSDFIGCMSQANVDYVIAHNPTIDPIKVHVTPNSIIPRGSKLPVEVKQAIRKTHGIPQSTVVFMYGGNMGKPQDVPHIIRCLRAVSERADCFFVLCGKGSDYGVLQKYIQSEAPKNLLLINGLPKTEYDRLLAACDAGLLFLDHRFTIPNFPSRMLSYMEYSMPVLACTDPNTDVGKVIVEGGFGWWCESNNPHNFADAVEKALTADMAALGANAQQYLTAHYTAKQAAQIICDKLKKL